MCILFFTPFAPQQQLNPRLAEEQVTCGPLLQDELINGRVFSLRTPRAMFDTATFLTRLAADQMPDVVVVAYDGSDSGLPCSLGAFPFPKVLVISEMHRSAAAMRRLFEYIRTQAFDRGVVTTGRRDAEFLQAAGVANVFWFPGLLFPYGDALVQTGRVAVRADRAVLTGSAGTSYYRRQRFAGALARAKLPVELLAMGPRELPDYFGASRFVINLSDVGEFGLDAFLGLASGATVLTERLPAEPGAAPLWRDGAEVVTFANPGELVDRVRHLRDHAKEAQAVADRGVRWFEDNFSEQKRRVAFERLVFDGLPLPAFALPSARTRAALQPATQNPTFSGLLAVQRELHRAHPDSDRVRIACDPALPAELRDALGSLPRTTLETADAAALDRVAPVADFVVISRAKVVPSTLASMRRVWVWDVAAETLGPVRKVFAESGFQSVEDAPVFVRPGADGNGAADAEGRRARAMLESGDASGALQIARRNVASNPRSLESFLVLHELALEGGNADLADKMLEKARGIAPEDPRVALAVTEPFRATIRQRPGGRALLGAWQALNAQDWRAAYVNAIKLRTALPECAEAYFIEGVAGIRVATDGGVWREWGKAIRALTRAAELGPRRVDFHHTLAVARRNSGGMMPDAVPAFEATLALNPTSADDWFGLGETLVMLGEAEKAERVLREAVQRAPHCLGLHRWLGHAIKRQGRIDEAQASYARSVSRRGANDIVVPRQPGTGKRRIIFVVQNGHSWPCMATVYEAFAADPRWEAIIVALPWQHPTFEATSQKNQDWIFQFLKDQKIPHVNWEEFPILETPADLLFLQNPYDNTRPKGWQVPDLIRAGHRLCYVPYAIEMVGNFEQVVYQFNHPLQQFAWAVCARSEPHRALFADHCFAGNHHVMATGHPKFDRLGRDQVAPDPELVEFARGRPLILWNPHHDSRLNGTRFGPSYSTFLRWRKFLLAEFRRRTDLAFVIRPHPTFFSAMEDRGFMTRAEAEAFIQECRDAGVFYHRSPAYFPLLAAADAIISDCVSLVVEFGITGKPVGHLYNPNGPVSHYEYAVDLDYVREHTSWLSSESQIRAFFDAVPTLMKDTAARETRARELRRRMGVCDEGIGNRVKRLFEERLALTTTAEIEVPALATVSA